MSQGGRAGRRRSPGNARASRNGRGSWARFQRNAPYAARRRVILDAISVWPAALGSTNGASKLSGTAATAASMTLRVSRGQLDEWARRHGETERLRELAHDDFCDERADTLRRATQLDDRAPTSVSTMSGRELPRRPAALIRSALRTSTTR